MLCCVGHNRAVGKQSTVFCNRLPWRGSRNTSPFGIPVLLLLLSDTKLGSEFTITFPQRKTDSSSSFVTTVFLRVITHGFHVQWRHHRCDLRNLDIIFITFKNPSFFYGRKWNYTVSKLSACLAFVSRNSWRIFTKFKMNVIPWGLTETGKF